MRYVYVKNGDAVDQVRRIMAGAEVSRSGPDAFICDFLRAHSADELLALCRSPRRERFVAPSVRAESYPVTGISAGRMMMRVRSALRVGIEIVRFRPDRILCGCSGELLWVSVLAAKILRVPIVHSRHNEVPERSGTGRLVGALDRLSIRTCDAVVCHGPFLADQIRTLGVGSNRTYEFEVDLSDFAGSNATAELPAELRELSARCSRLVVFVGRMQRDKGIFDLLEAFRTRPGGDERRVGLVYAGDGKDLESLRRRIAELAVQDSVLLLGRVPHGQLPGVMRAASVVVTPTRREFPEGRCMVVLESLALGVPVIAPNFGPFPYAVEHGVNGLLFDPNDVASLRRCLVQVLDESGALERLRRGAAHSARQLLGLPRSFASAVDSAFGTTEGMGVK